jgi:hypothetical protein
MDMAAKYAMNKKRSQPSGEECVGPECGGCSSPGCQSGGGGAEAGGDDGDIVGRIMAKRMSKGGEVANDTSPEAPFEENEFDLLEKTGGLSHGELGSNEHGNAAMDENDSELIRRIMRARANTDRNPRPA